MYNQSMFRNLFRQKYSPRKFTKTSFFLWLLSIVVFFLFLYLESVSKKSDIYGNALGITILVGVISFIFTLVGFLFEGKDKNIVGDLIKEERKRNFSSAKIIVALVFLVLVGNYIHQSNIKSKKELLLLEKEINELKYETNKQNALPTTSTQVQQQPTTPQQVVVQDTDPIIDCKSVECGTIKIRRSACNVSICCELEDGWVWANSETECRNAQNVEYEAYKREQDKEREEYEKKLEEEDKAWDISVCKSKATQNLISCNRDCLEVIGINAELGQICMNSCKEDENRATDLCNQQ